MSRFNKHAFGFGIAGLIIISAALVVFAGLDPFSSSAGSDIAMAVAGAGAVTQADYEALVNKLGEITGKFNAKSEELDRASRELAARTTAVEQEVVRRPGRGGGQSVGNTLGDALSRHSNFNALGALAETRGKVTLSVKAMITSLPDSGGSLVPVDVRTDPIMMQRRRLLVRNLVAPGQTASGSVGFTRQTLRDLNAGVVSEGARKPESNVEFEMDTAMVRTIPHWIKASRQILADAPALRTAIDGELRYGVALAEEDEMLFGDGTGQHLHGIVPQSSAYEISRDKAGDTRFDTLAHALAQAQVALLPATGIVMNDDDLEQLKVIKDADGRYIGGGPFGPPITSIWGRPAVGTPIMDPGTFLTGAFFDGAQIWDREEVNVMVATENEDDFVRNLATILCEERLAFAVKRPQAFVYGSFPDGAS